jgi:protein FrlC
VTSRELRRFLDDVGADNLKGLSDTDQMALAGEDINDYFDNLGNKYGFVHFSDAGHTVPGTGGLPMKQYYETLKARGYEGWCSCELCSREYYIDPDKATDAYLDYLTNVLEAIK